MDLRLATLKVARSRSRIGALCLPDLVCVQAVRRICGSCARHYQARSDEQRGRGSEDSARHAFPWAFVSILRLRNSATSDSFVESEP